MYNCNCNRVICIAPPTEDRRRITKQSSIFPMSVGTADWGKNVFSWRRIVVVDRSSFRSVGSQFHARGAATEKALSPIRRRVRGTTRSPDDEARSADRAGTSATDVSYGPITIAIRARFDYDSTTIRLQHATTRYEVFRALAYEIVYENQW